MEKQKNDISFSFINFCARNFFWVALLISLLVLILGFSFLIWPKYKQITSDSEGLSEKRDQFLTLIRESRKYLNEVNELTSFYNDISKDDFDKINSILPECGDQEELFGEMDKIIKNNGLILNSISIKSTDTKTKDPGGDNQITSQKRKTIEISFGLGGINYIGLKNFLGDIEKNLRILDVRSLSFDPNNNFLNISIQTYCLE